MAERRCLACNQLQPATAEGDKCLYCGAELPPVEVETAGPTEAPAPDAEAAAPLAPPAPVEPAVEEPVPEGKRKCPNCGEILYETEKRCWRCGHETAQTAPAAPSVAPPAAAPAVAAPPVVPPTATAPPYVPPTAPAVEPAAQNLGVWALVVGLASWFCCPIIGSVIAIVLGVKAKNAGVTGLGIAGIVLGIISLLFWVPGAILGIIGYFVAKPAGAPIPEATSWLWSLRWMLS